MGICMPKELRNQADANRKISAQLKKERNLLCEHVKVLLLGTGESGKSTILKQMQILHTNGFTAAQIHEFKEIIYSNTIQCMAVLVAALKDTELHLDDPELEVDCKMVTRYAASRYQWQAFSPELFLALKRLWTDNGIRSCYEQRHRLQLPDCARTHSSILWAKFPKRTVFSYLDSLDRINGADFEPSNEDILFTRVATTGVAEVSFDVKDKECTFHVFDVGGQRSERRKWIHVFDDVAAVIFLTALSEYNQTMREDENTNRMLDSLQLFASIISSEFFTETIFILFLNKRDLFAAKIRTVPITVAFPDFSGEQDYNSAMSYIKGKYRDLNVNVSKALIMHETCATDTNQVQHVINGVIDTITATHLAGAGVL